MRPPAASLLSITVVLAVGAPFHGHAWSTEACQSLVPYHGGPTACYSPSQVGAAERRFGHSVIRPTLAMRQIGGPKLTQVILVGFGPYVNVTRVDAITYVFGTPEPFCQYISGCQAGSPYAIVEEILGRISYPKIFVACYPSVPGPCHAVSNLPHRRLTVTIETNLTRVQTAQMARSIVDSARAIKPRG